MSAHSSKTGSSLAQIAKAIAAGATAASGALATALAEDGIGGGEAALVVLAGVGAFALTWAVPNAEPGSTAPEEAL